MLKFTSRCFVYQGRPGAVTTETITFEAGPEDLVVEVMRCARCGTDKTVYRVGHSGIDPHAPVVLGHELVGKIVYIGDRVKDLKKGIGYLEGSELSAEYLNFTLGQRVTFQSRVARYRNGLMLIPNPITNLSFQINGGYSQYMLVPAALIQSGSVLAIPDNVSDESACLAEPSACALESIYATPHPTGVDREGRHVYRAGLQPGGNTCIIGSGTVSMIYARLAMLEGVERVVMVVRSEKKRELVERLFGSDVEVYQTPASDAQSAREAEDAIVGGLTELTDGYLFDDVIAACSSPAAQQLMLRLYTPEGYGVGACFGGTHTSLADAEVDNHHYQGAKTVGTSGCSTDGMKAILAMLESGKLSLDGFTSSQRFTLDDDPHEFLSTDADGLKPVLYPNC